jgi:drug/metabolite transporter (DMT)-like permease
VLAFRGAPTITPATALACVATGVLGPYLHGLLFLLALVHVDAGKASLMNRVQPAVVFVLSWLLLGKVLGTNDLASAALIVLGVAALTLARRRSASA